MGYSRYHETTAYSTRQLGLGSTLTLPFVTVPSEVILTRYAALGSSARCTDIAAGGDLALFTVERPTHVDVLACGQGQWGGLGNGTFSTAQGEARRIRGVSGLSECAVQPIQLPTC